MSVEVTRDEFTALEREVDGEKLVTRHILEQTRRNGDDLAIVKTRLDRLEGKVDALRGDFQALRGNVEGLTKSLPQIVGEVMRDVLDERGEKR